MCGICGLIGSKTSQPGKKTTVRRMMERLKHRGPDGEGFQSGSNYIFGHTRLAIIDIEGGQQPMITPDGRYTLIFNGEIYNYLELRQWLTQKGIRFKTFSDTEVLLQLLVNEGEKAFDKLNGMFAFAFFDNQTKKWLLARDHFGIKPLYYTRLPDEIVFASEIKALLEHPEIVAERDDQALQEYLTFQFCLDDRTLFKGIHKLEPGCYISGSDNEIKKIVRYWDTDYRIDEHHTEVYFIDRLRELLEDSLRFQIRSDVPLGAYLSGGIDSSVVSTLAADHLNFPIKTFHGYFAEGPQYDESRFAILTAGAINSEILTVKPTFQEFIEDLEKLIYAMDEPMAGPGLFPQYRVSKLAAQHVKVILGGQGGDEIFGGYARYLVGYLEQALKGAIFETQEEGKHLVTLNSIIPNLPILQQYKPLMQHFWKEGLFQDMDVRYFHLIDRSPDLKELLTYDAADNINRKEIFQSFQRTFNHPDTKSYFNKMTHFDQKTLLPALLQVEDRVSMAVSLESRVPLLDTRIVDLVTSMPPPMKFQAGKTKNILKKAVTNLIPEPVLNRKDKMGFPVPLKEWMTAGPVKNFATEILLSKASRERGIFFPKSIEKLINTEGAFGRQLWGALCLELWHQRFIDSYR